MRKKSELDRYQKAVQTRRENYAKLTPEEKEAKRQHFREAFWRTKSMKSGKNKKIPRNVVQVSSVDVTQHYEDQTEQIVGHKIMEQFVQLVSSNIQKIVVRQMIDVLKKIEENA